MPDSLATIHEPEASVAPVKHAAAKTEKAKEQKAKAESKPEAKAEAKAAPGPEASREATAADTTSAAAPDSLHAIVNALEQRTCHETDAPRILHLRNATLGRMAYTEGILPEPRPQLPGYDSGVMTLLIVLFLIITGNFRHYSTFIKTFAQDLFTVRRRANVFDESHTMSETRVLLSLITLVCVCEGTLLFSALTFHGATIGAFTGVLMMSLLAAGYYCLQNLAYRTVGFLFAASADTTQWLRGFNASQSLLGLGLTIPALLSLFNPGMAPLLLSISIFMYGAARIIFISKGFRIFYDNYSSLIYFILYLCTLEIIPPVILYRLASYISLNF